MWHIVLHMWHIVLHMTLIMVCRWHDVVLVQCITSQEDLATWETMFILLCLLQWKILNGVHWIWFRLAPYPKQHRGHLTSRSAHRGFVAFSSHSSAGILPGSQTSRWSGPESKFCNKYLGKSLDQADLGTDGGYGVDAGGDPEAVPVTQLLPLSPVEGDPGGVSAVRRHWDLQFNACWHNDRPGEFDNEIRQKRRGATWRRASVDKWEWPWQQARWGGSCLHQQPLHRLCSPSGWTRSNHRPEYRFSHIIITLTWSNTWTEVMSLPSR